MTRPLDDRRLPVLCPQQYEAEGMRVVACTQCAIGWNKKTKTCTIGTGAEGLPDELDVPTCPMQAQCRHQIQSAGPCVIRRKGFICESALIWSGMDPADALMHPLSFNADMF